MFAALSWLFLTSSKLLPGWLVRWQERKGIFESRAQSKASMLKGTKFFPIWESPSSGLPDPHILH